VSREKVLTDQVLKYLRARGGWWVKIHGGPYQTSGIPDIVGCYRGKFLGLEVKPSGRKSDLSLRQQVTLTRIRDAGGISALISSTQDALDVLDEVDKLAQERR